jgi:hypothetical protein
MWLDSETSTFRMPRHSEVGQPDAGARRANFDERESQDMSRFMRSRLRVSAAAAATQQNADARNAT